LVIYKESSIRLIADFPSEATEARRQWKDSSKEMKENGSKPRIPYPVELFFKHKIEFQIFQDKPWLAELHHKKKY
jgi:hypothetical protein